MSVDLRCPTCGTTQGHPGDCEACFEGEVRYFCTNHDEAIWIEGPVCSRCGAKFGDAAKKQPTAPRVPIPPAGAPDFRPPGGRRTPERMAEPDFGRRPTTGLDREGPAEPEGLPPTLIETLLTAIAADHARARAGGRYEAEPPRTPSARGPRFPIGGCLLRIVGLVFLLIAAAVIFLLMVFGGFVIG